LSVVEAGGALTERLRLYSDGGNPTFSSKAGVNFSLANNNSFTFLFGGMSGFRINANYESEELTWGMRGGSGKFGRQVVFCDYDTATQDFDHAETTNPTIFIHSALAPNTSNNQWGSFTHDQTNFVITTGANVGAGTTPTTIDNGIVFAPRGSNAVTIDGTGNINMNKAAKGLVLKQGANGKCGTFVLNGATPVTVSNTSVAITDVIMFSLNTVGGTVGAYPVIQTITAGTGFTVAGTAGDTSTMNYSIISNAA
jgi:hypothetical protein